MNIIRGEARSRSVWRNGLPLCRSPAATAYARPCVDGDTTCKITTRITREVDKGNLIADSDRSECSRRSGKQHALSKAHRHHPTHVDSATSLPQKTHSNSRNHLHQATENTELTQTALKTCDRDTKQTLPRVRDRDYNRSRQEHGGRGDDLLREEDFQRRDQSRRTVQKRARPTSCSACITCGLSNGSGGCLGCGSDRFSASVGNGPDVVHRVSVEVGGATKRLRSSVVVAGSASNNAATELGGSRPNEASSLGMSVSLIPGGSTSAPV
jgi:hypothetical protein